MNPSTGTFISMDPAQGSIFDPVSLHKYLYANANPVMNSDPSGRETLAEMGAAIGMQAAIGAIVGGSMEASMRVLAYLTSGNEVDAGNLVFEFFDGFMQGAIIGGVFGALFGAFGAIAAESILANCVLRSAFLTMGLANSFDGIKGILGGNYWGGSLKIVEGILWGLGALPNYYRGGIENSTYTTAAETNPTKSKGWRLGDPPDNLTAAGKEPSWSTVRQRYWKNEAYYNSNQYSAENVSRMQKGLAPQQMNLKTGMMESMEIHHNYITQSSGLPDMHAPWNLKPVWPDEHAMIDPNRFTGG